MVRNEVYATSRVNIQTRAISAVRSHWAELMWKQTIRKLVMPETALPQED